MKENLIIESLSDKIRHEFIKDAPKNNTLAVDTSIKDKLILEARSNVASLLAALEPLNDRLNGMLDIISLAKKDLGQNQAYIDEVERLIINLLSNRKQDAFLTKVFNHILHSLNEKE